MNAFVFFIMIAGIVTTASGRNLDRTTPPPRGGEATLHGTVGGESRIVPAMVGKIAESDDLKRYLEGSGFTYKVVARKKGTGKPSGTILSQEPRESSEVHRALEIRLIIAD
ncbi:MAG TPA: PASTA domain-containing protein [Oligoflexus sp.]|uniref:PASTA domain-containing protein n=1 Tax=Oligoflexus sp. TaxID=1971216 RepID=UPI002D7E61B7|nr:PASTA domain-containing protein [Oligoflexus sp.]HET9240179.1 PASTA domain-containing protein [Oligoflexus sp.]